MALSDKQVQMFTDKIRKSLNEGIAPWSRQWRTGGMENYPKSGYTGKNYNGYNTMVLLMNDYKDPRYFTWNQIEKIDGCFVGKGQKSTMVLSYFPVYKLGIDKKPIIEKGQKVVSHYMPKGYLVWNAEQLRKEDGTPFFEPWVITPRKEVCVIQDAEEVIADYRQRHGGMPTYEESPVKNAYYRPLTDHVVVPTLDRFEHNGVGNGYRNRFHEFAHSTGHSTRLNREGIQSVQFGSETYSKEELVAEIAAMFICFSLGIQFSVENSAAYIKGWQNAINDEPKHFVPACYEAQKAANLILGDFTKEFGVTDENDETESE